MFVFAFSTCSVFCLSVSNKDAQQGFAAALPCCPTSRQQPDASGHGSRWGGGGGGTHSELPQAGFPESGEVYMGVPNALIHMYNDDPLCGNEYKKEL